MLIRSFVLPAAFVLLVGGITGCAPSNRVANEDEQRGELICTEQAVTGTRIKRKVCRTPAQASYEREQSKKALNRALGTAGATSGN